MTKKSIASDEAIKLSNDILSNYSDKYNNYKVTKAEQHGTHLILSIENGTPEFDGDTLNEVNAILKSFVDTHEVV